MLACIGALLSLLVLAIQPFVQEVVKFPIRYVNSTDALIPIADRFEDIGIAQAVDQYGLGLNGLDWNMMQAVYAGMFSQPNTSFNISATCFSGNCSWTTYETLGICNQCANITSQLEKTVSQSPGDSRLPASEHYLLRNGFGLGGVVSKNELWYNSTLNVSAALIDRMSITVSTEGYMGGIPDTVAFAGRGSALASIIAVGAWPINASAANFFESFWYSTPPVAYECLLQFCIQERNATFNGSLLEETVDTWTNNSSPVPGDMGGESPYVFHSSKTGKVFEVSYNAASALGSFMAGLLVGNVTMLRNEENRDDLWATARYSSNQIEAILQSMNSSNTGFHDFMDRMASSLTYSLRNLEYQSDPAQGQAYSATTFIEVRWAWLSLPFALILFSFIFLLAVIIQSSSRGMIPWKTDILATLFHGVDPRDLQTYQPLDRIDRMKEVADQLHVEAADDDSVGTEGRRGYLKLTREG